MDKGRRQVVTRDGDERDSKPRDGVAIWSSFLTAEEVHTRSYMIVFTLDRLAAGKKTVFLDFFATVITSSRQQEVSRVTVMRL